MGAHWTFWNGGPWRKALVVWFGMLGLAFVNGALREFAIARFVSEPLAHHLSALTAAVLFGVLAWSQWPRIGVTSPQQAWRIGTLWLVLTVAVETLLVGRWVERKPWPEILAAYDLVGGSSWPLVLAWILVLPGLLWAFRRKDPSLRPLTPSSANSH